MCADIAQNLFPDMRWKMPDLQNDPVPRVQSERFVRVVRWIVNLANLVDSLPVHTNVSTFAVGVNGEDPLLLLISFHFHHFVPPVLSLDTA